MVRRKSESGALRRKVDEERRDGETPQGEAQSGKNEPEPAADATAEGVTEVELSDVVSDAGSARAPEPAAAADELPIELEEVIQERDRELAELRDKYLRLAADFDNFRKRTAKERADLLKFASENLARQLLEVVDDLERALAHADAADRDVLVQGVRLVENKFLQCLERFGIKRFSALGESFDPSIHEAVQEVTSDSVPAGGVVFEVHKGYMYHDRLLRPARVVISRGPAEAGGGAEAPPEAAGGDGSRPGNGGEGAG
jgi:molecular chaperone GrpE